MNNTVQGHGTIRAAMSILLILAVCIIPALADETNTPQLPHAFYGPVSIQGVPAPAYAVVTAVVMDGGGTVTTEVPGFYGGVNSLEYEKHLFVHGFNDTKIPEGSLITFRVNGIPAEVFDVQQGGSWMAAYPFKSGGVTELALNVTGFLHTISATSGTGGSIIPNGSVWVLDGQNQAFGIFPQDGFVIDKVYVDGISQGVITTYTFMNVTTDHTIHATFKVPVITYTITASAGSHGSISPSGSVPVNQGDDITFTITPDSGYLIDQVTVDGTPQGAVPSYTFSDVQANHVIQATFIPQVVTYTITASAGSHGTISPSGSVVVPQGNDITFTITPDSGYLIDQVTVDGTPQGALPSYTFTNVQANHVIQATFIPQVVTYTITASAGSHGSISPSGSVVVPQGDDITFTITPDSGYLIDQVTVDGTPQGALPSYTFTNVQANHVIQATFIPQVVTYTITASAGSHGTISPSGSVVVPQGNDITFTITPDSGYLIDQVTVDGTPQGALPSYTFTNVQANHVIQATFIPQVVTYTITASAGSHGTISPSGSVTVGAGDDVTFTLTPDGGYQVDQVTVDGSPQGAIVTYTFYDVMADHSIQATFRPCIVTTYTITATTGPNGTIIPLGNVVVNAGENMMFTITPDSTYRVDQVTVDGVPEGALTNYTFVNVMANHTIHATFRAGGPVYLIETLGSGWNLFSTPVTLEPGHKTLGTVFDPSTIGEILLILGWNSQQNIWYIPGPAENLNPLTVYYVKVNSTANALIYPSQSPSAPPSRYLQSGINLIGPAPAYETGGFPAMPLDQALISIREAPGNLTGYTMVLSPAHNQPGWTYALGGTLHDLLPFKGYWVVMENPDTLYGFSTTPI